MTVKLRIFYSFAVFMLFLTPNLAWANSVEGIRFGVHENNTRIVLDLNDYATYKLDTLPSPPRLIVDLPANISISGNNKADMSKRVKSIRYGRPNSKTRRIVFDLNAPAEITQHFSIPKNTGNPNHRIIIDFKSLDSNSRLNSSPEPTRVIEFQPQVLLETTPRVTYALPSPKPPSFPTVEPKFKKQYLIVIDPGHGGGDPGAIGHNGAKEKDVVLSLARTIKVRLEATGRFKVRLTRTSDHYIKLRERFQRARDLRGNLFISLHADKIHLPKVRGASVYTLSENASDKETARLARQENNAGVVAGLDLAIEDNAVADILLDLARRETLNESKLFAELFVESMKENNINLLNNTHRYAGFAVLKAPDIPSVLIEAGFMSNRNDAQLLQSSAYQTRIAIALESTIHKFFDRIEHLQSM